MGSVRSVKGRPSVPTQPAKNTPKKLVKLWRELGYNYYKVAKVLGINSGHVYALIVKGVEPAREDLRRKLFLRAKKSKEELEKIREQRKQRKEDFDKEVEKHLKEVLG